MINGAGNFNERSQGVNDMVRRPENIMGKTLDFVMRSAIKVLQFTIKDLPPERADLPPGERLGPVSSVVRALALTGRFFNR